jgi:chemotaxis signal transduction protein
MTQDLDIFQQRALRLAARTEGPKEIEKKFPILTFTIAGERYSFALSELSSVIKCSNLSPAPLVGPEVLGVIPLQGKISIVLDLLRLLNRPTASTAPHLKNTNAGHALLFKHSEWSLGIWVQEIGQLDFFSSHQQLQIESMRKSEHSLFLKPLQSAEVTHLKFSAILESRILRRV